jgi:hypothetical protein
MKKRKVSIMSKEAYIRKTIRRIILESNGHNHRCLNGKMVDKDSVPCYNDICSRIEDVEYERNSNNRGTANRAYYNGVLSDLRKRKRRLAKLHGINKN